MIVVKIIGPQGSGKSEIARRVRAMLEREGATVLTDGTDGLGYILDSVHIVTANEADDR